MFEPSCAESVWPPLHHGGRLREASARYGIAAGDWLDLSTGINPHGWPAPPIPPSVWSRLPEDDDELANAAREYYGAASALPVAGSQAAIQALPFLRKPCRVAILSPGYAEHDRAWRRAGHLVHSVPGGQVDGAASTADVLVLIHPNNPTGARFSATQMMAWHARLSARGGWLVVDEAFIDPAPEQSMASHSTREGVIVLRSLGKFFGLAGARVGFVLAQDSLLQRLRAALGPWCVAAPSRWIAIRALRDHAWQESARTRLHAASERLAVLLSRHALCPAGGCALFQWVATPHADALHERLARAGILTRRFADPLSLRFGLPAVEGHWARLGTALASVSCGTGKADGHSTRQLDPEA